MRRKASFLPSGLRATYRFGTVQWIAQLPVHAYVPAR
jgi:hypothetical protein